MGRHERQEIENAEKIVVKLLNNQELDPKDSKNKWFEHAQVISIKILKDFGTIKEARHIGNIYNTSEIGDIKIIKEETSNWRYIELKMSENPKSKGTLANISQDALSNAKLFGNGIINPWSKFRAIKKYSTKIQILLNQYSNYPAECNRGTIVEQIENKARHLRDLFKKVTKIRGNIANKVCNYKSHHNIKEIATILCKISNFAKMDKIEYLVYLSKFEQDEENIKKFTIAMLIGYHTQLQLNYILGLPYQNITNLISHYSVYYTNQSESKIVASSDDLVEEAKKIINSQVGILIPNNQTNLLITMNGRIILRVVLNWKNVFQGIKTPCLNIFKEN